MNKNKIKLLEHYVKLIEKGEYTNKIGTAYFDTFSDHLSKWGTNVSPAELADIVKDFLQVRICELEDGELC